MGSLDFSNVLDGYKSQALSRTVFSAYLPMCLTLCLTLCVFILLFLFMATRKHVFFI